MLPDRQRRRPHIQLTIPFDALQGSDSACELAGYGPISAGQGRAVIADGPLRRLVCDPPSGTLLDLGRTIYQPPAARCEIDHRDPYHPGRADGGHTSADNCDCLCKHHHRVKDAGGFHPNRDPDGTITFTTPLGRTTTRPPHRLWHTPDPTPTAPTAADPAARGADLPDPKFPHGKPPF